MVSSPTADGRPSPVEVSIVVPVYNHWRLTKACLESLLESARTSRLSAEVLLSDDASTDETEQEWPRLNSGQWPIRYLRNPAQLGFLRNVNAAAAQAAGTYLCILNNDVVVEPAWLDKLVASLTGEPDVGAVGPLFLDGNGRILECGGMVHADGSARQLGHDASVADRRYAYLNDVDYVSAACLLLRTDLFRELGGFDERYAPAYYEDTDLCLRLAERRLRVLVNPAVRIVHHEGGSHGTSASSGLKRYQELNRSKFIERWSHRLAASHPDPHESEDRIRTWRRRETIAFYYPRPLTHEMDSGALRLLRLMLQLRRRGKHVLMVNVEEDGPRLDGIHAAGIESMRATWGGEDHHVERLRLAAPDVAVFSHLQSEERFAKSYYELSPSTVRIFDTVDLQFLREARRTAISLGLSGDPILTPQNLSRDGLAEMAAAERSDMTLVVSNFERRLLTESFFLEPGRVRVVSNLHEPADALVSYEERKGFVFLAGFAHPPNVDAIVWMASAIWPLVRARLPDARLEICGSSTPREVRALHRPAQGIFVRGYVGDHRQALASARVMLSPLRYGAGVKGKLGEAMAVGTPVVTTPVGAEGMDEEGRAMAIAEAPEELAELAVALHGDPREWSARSRAGLEILTQKFSAQANTDALLTAIADATDMRSSPTPHELVSRLLWYELGNPGEPHTVEMSFHHLISARELPSISRRLWRYYRTHGFRALGRRIAAELRLRRAVGRARG